MEEERQLRRIPWTGSAALAYLAGSFNTLLNGHSACTFVIHVVHRDTRDAGPFIDSPATGIEQLEEVIAELAVEVHTRLAPGHSSAARM